MRIFRRHVESELVPALEGALAPAAARRVEAHLADCGRCREARDEIARGLGFVRALPDASLPESRATAIRAALREATPPPHTHRRRWLVPAACAAALVAGAVWWQVSQAPRLESAPGDEPPSAFEQMAIDLHERGLGASGASLITASVSEARAWGRRRTGVDVSLPAQRPAEDDGRFDLRGVQAVDYRGAAALGVWYSVDGGPVTMTVAHARDVPDGAPAWTLAGKRVRRRAVGGHKVLSWTNAGQSYVLVSDLPADGLRACLVCHTQPARRELIDRLAR